MARYEFQCPKCEAIVELTKSIHDDSLPLCCAEGCDVNVVMERIISASTFHLKGLGWSAEGYSKTGID